jgi:hypothetical protein
VLCLGERGIRRFLVSHHERERKIAGRIVVPDPGRVLLGRVLDIHHRGQRLVVDFHFLGGDARLLRRLGYHEGDAVADVARLDRLEQRPERAIALRAAHILGHEKRRDAAQAVLARVVTRQHADHAGQRERLGRIDAADARVRVRGHDHRAVQHVRQLDIVDVPRAPGEKALVLDPAHGLTDSEAAHLLRFNMKAPPKRK